VRKTRFKTSLFGKFILPVLVFILVPSLINLFYAAYSAADALETESGNSLSRLAMEKKNEVDLVFDSQFSLLDVWVNDWFTVEFFRELNRTRQADPEKLRQLTAILEERFRKAGGLYENIFFTFDDKVVADGVGGASVGYVMDRELEAYYYRQLENPGLDTGAYMYSPITGRPAIPVINSILDEGSNRVLTTLVIAVDVNRLTENLVQSSEGQVMGTMILDWRGMVIAADKSELALNLNFSEQEGLTGFFGDMEANGTGSGKFVLDGVDYIASYLKHDRHGFYILTYMPVDQYMGEVNTLKWNIAGVILVSVLVSVIVVFLIIRSLVNPIKIIARSARQIADGDLTAPEVRLRSRDELGELAGAFNSMVGRLKELVKQIGATSERVAASASEFSSVAGQSAEISRQVARTIQDVSAGTEEQSRHISSSVAQIREMTDGVRNIAESAQNATAQANLAAEKADAGAATVYSSISEINTVNENILRVSEKIRKLGERTQEIHQIVNVITQIANQTNLLALNASIEAARAGEQGRGFSVVAQEVRKLADQTRDSSDQIKALIDAILSETEQTVLSMDEAVEQSSRGIEAIHSVEQTFGDIQRSVNEANMQIQEVASAAEQMNSAVEQIAANIQEISKISMATAAQAQDVTGAMEEELASAEEISSSSREMAKLAEELRALVNQFKIR
jgi:methyl-accepting chemotaxis protein